MINRVIFHNAHGTASESASGNTGTDHARSLPCQIHQDVDLLAGYFIIIPQGYMGLIHQFPEAGDVIGFQRRHRLDGALVLRHRVFCTLNQNRVFEHMLMLFKFFHGQVAQRLNVRRLLQCGKRVRTFLTSVVVSRIHQAVLHFAVHDDDPGIFQLYRRILIMQGAGIQEDGIVLLPHGHRELVHDAAVAAVEVIFRILADERDVHHAQIRDVIQAAEDHTCEHFQRGRGRKPASVGDITPDHHVKSGIQCISFFMKGPYHAQGIICPAVSFLIGQLIQRSFDYPEAVQVHRIKMNLAVRAFPRNAVGADGQRARKYMSAVIVRMLPDQIDAPRRKVNFGSFSISKQFRKFFEQFFFHVHQSPHFLV